MANFYILNKNNYDTIFTDTPNSENLILKPEHFSGLLEFIKMGEQRELGQLREVIFKKTTVLIEEKYDFIFVLISQEQKEGIAYSQLFFLMNLFLYSFDIYDKETAKNFLDEIKLVKKPLSPSMVISEVFKVNSIISNHVKDIEFRNLLEIFENIINSLCTGIKKATKSQSNEEEINQLLRIDVNKLINDYKEIDKLFFFNKEGFFIKDELNSIQITEIENCSQMKEIFLNFTSELVDIIRKYFSPEQFRELINKNTKPLILDEWRRLSSINIERKLVEIFWR
ncbi:MAG: hypothetical protein K9W46_11390 [Candidatus Heimdallarchaeum endolithica]|uniref:Uncharacterized protein n=1 Tax=Candidatus Heimdallarchaeum endolithica TaxID=2876572 RepID=A0A9Y1BQ93_9ARCH|nr:MAG: hypothetical protein K9W46_11390 [Candidatus Heimdallarchaeum endolithica]